MRIAATYKTHSPDYRVRQRRNRPLSPRVRMAVRLYASGLVPTKGAAAEAMGLCKGTFYILTSPKVNDAQVSQLHTQVDQMVSDTTIDTRKLIDLMARRAIGVQGNLMMAAEDESVKLRAAQDFMDRGSETGKIQKHQIESWSLNGKDAQGIAEAMVEAARVRATYGHLEHENFIRIESTVDKRANAEEVGTERDLTQGATATESERA